MPSKAKLIVYGYIRENKKKYQLNVPLDILNIILIFYQTEYKIYGIGEQRHHEMGVTELTKNKFHYLKEASKLCHDPKFLFPHFYHALIYANNNEIYGCGTNYSGCLGLSHQDSFATFTKINSRDIDDENYIVDIMSKGLCSRHNFIIFKHKITGQQLFYAFGLNGNNQTDTKYEIFSTQKIIEISTGEYHSLFLSESGRVYACGRNYAGQCGIDPNTMCKIDSPQIIPFLYNIISISNGRFHNLCIDKQNVLWVFGDSSDGKLD